MHHESSWQSMPEPAARQQPKDEAKAPPGGPAGIAALVGAAFAAAAVVLVVALAWVSMAVSVLTEMAAAAHRIPDVLDDDVHFVGSTDPAGTMPSEFASEAARTAKGASSTYPSQPARPFPTHGDPARQED